MAAIQNAQPVLNYLDMEAYVGITKHNGGFGATDELLSLCHIEEAQEALNVGCGIGVGSAYVARTYDCRVVGVDISEKMTDVPIAATWQALWEESGLRDRVVRLCQINPRAEVRNRIRWVGWRWAVRAVGRLLRLYVTYPAARQSLKDIFGMPLDVVQQMGYGLFAGRK
jgi:SAM-dependent methyltransferase